MTEPHCSLVSTGAVLLADIIPSMVVKLSFPFFMQRIPFGMRHGVVVLLQCVSYFMVAYSTSVAMSLAGGFSASVIQCFDLHRTCTAPAPHLHQPVLGVVRCHVFKRLMSGVEYLKMLFAVRCPLLPRSKHSSFLRVFRNYLE